MSAVHYLQNEVARWVRVEYGRPFERLVCGLCAVLALLWARERYALIWVVGESMEPTLHNGSLVVVDKAAYRHAGPRRDDLVVAWYRGELIAKRVVGLPHETVEAKQGVVYIDGVAHCESHGVLAGNMTISPGTLFADRYALLGDNRSLPAGVLVHAVVSPSAFLGKVLVWWPVYGRKDRWSA